MKKILHVIFFIGLTACGPSAEEIAKRQAQIADSITKVAQEELLRQQAEEEEQGRLKQQLIELKSALAGAEDKLQSLHQFHLLRSQDERASQISEQTKEVELLKLEIGKLESKIK
jgi:hypothetical protein